MTMSDIAAAEPAMLPKTTQNTHGSPIWYELLTQNAESAARFYQALVPGWIVGPPSPDHGGYRQIAIAGDGHAGGMIELTPQMIASGARPVWLGYVGVDDVDAAIDRLIGLGGSIQMPAFDIAGVGRLAMVADPDGNPFYLMRGASQSASEAFSGEQPGHVSWNELVTDDPAGARRFYGALLGWTSEEFMPMGELGEYRFLDHAGTTIGAICPRVEGAPAGWRYYVRVPSIAAAVAAIGPAGGTIAMGPHQVPGGDHIIIGHDPEGAQFALVGSY